MPTINENSLSKLLAAGVVLRKVEPDIYSVLPSNEVGNTYDNKFGFFYDLVACNPIYNRLIWGYSTSKFETLVDNALKKKHQGIILDVGCGSLAFSAKTYCLFSDKPVVLLDQSLKLLRIAKSRLVKLNGKVPDNLIFLHADAMQLPFLHNTFNTIIALNLLHVLDDIHILLNNLKNIVTEDGKMLFTTLIKGKRLADKYLKVWEDAGEVVARDMECLQSIFNELHIPITYEIDGNMTFINCISGINNKLE